MGVPSMLGRLLCWCGLACVLCGFVGVQTAEAQIWVVTEPDGSERFTSRPEPGARVYMATRHDSRPTYSTATSGEFRAEIGAAAADTGLDPALIRAVIATESAFDPTAVSPKGAQGLMQLMPATARELRVKNVWNPMDNIGGGARHLARLVKRYADLSLALAAYNAGEGAVDRYGGIPPYRETQDYVQRVLTRMERYQGTSE